MSGALRRRSLVHLASSCLNVLVLALRVGKRSSGQCLSGLPDGSRDVLSKAQKHQYILPHRLRR